MATGTGGTVGSPGPAGVVVVAPSQTDGALQGGRGVFPCLAAVEASPKGDRRVEEAAGSGTSMGVDHVDNYGGSIADSVRHEHETRRLVKFNFTPSRVGSELLLKECGSDRISILANLCGD